MAIKSFDANLLSFILNPFASKNFLKYKMNLQKNVSRPKKRFNKIQLNLFIDLKNSFSYSINNSLIQVDD
ncbi:hypothetical protein BpHYR1_043775 [Brachionus plicatilis]|uniref:Uncharacterized protein n=1 Tax=Brachionus plicatilis TaxID=10195 RepID=A0A3M7RK15_BRAPC|nr:hypothetical protein BpHYR1_043775 [Brachionus plicatilis]